MSTLLSSRNKSVEMGPGLPTVIIGERINPTGRSKMAKALQNRDFALIKAEAMRQIACGAQVLDVNVGAAGIDETKVLPEVIKVLSEVIDVPLCLDSSNPAALEAALKIYEGRALVNSVTGEKVLLDRILPLIKEYEAVVVALCMDENGIPEGSNARVDIARRILDYGQKYGLGLEDYVIDCLAMTVGTNHLAAQNTLQAMRILSSELGCNLTLGASNISHGLPDRKHLNCAFFALSVEAGATCLIVDPTVPGIRRIIRAADLLAGRDEWALGYIEDYRLYKDL